PQSRKDDLAFRRTPLSLLLRPTSQAGSAWRRSRGFHGHLRWPFRRFLQRFPGLAAWLELHLPFLEPTEYLCACAVAESWERNLALAQMKLYIRPRRNEPSRIASPASESAH